MNPAETWLKGHEPLIRRGLRKTIALGLAGGILLIAQAWLLARVVNGAVFAHQSLADALPWLLAMLPVFLLRFLLTQLAERSAFELSARVQSDLRAAAYGQLRKLGPLWLNARSSGDMANRVSTGIEAIGGYYARWLPNRALSVMTPLAILAAVFPSDWVSGLALVLTAPLIPVFMILIGRGAEELNQRQWRQLARMSARFMDSLRGIATLKLFNASQRETEVVAAISESYRASSMKVLRVAFLSSLTLEFLSTISIAVVAVFIGFRLLWGEMLFLPGFFVLLLAPEYYLPLRSLGAHYHTRMEAIGAAEGLLEIAEAPLPEAAGPAAETADDEPIGVVFDNVAFDYAPDRPALAGVSFAARAGRVTALVGASGAGKSTLFNLLLGVAGPHRGGIEINGRRYGDFTGENWLSHIAWAPQRPHVFDGTVGDNIRLGRPQASMAEVEAAARAARAHGFIQGLPQGYDTPVGERGLGLSGGQVQRLALARAFLRKAPLVLLDEATAHLDQATEAEIVAAIAELARGRTVMMATHRPAILELADHIVVLKDGRVAESGSRDELLERHGGFAFLLAAGQ